MVLPFLINIEVASSPWKCLREIVLSKIGIIGPAPSQSVQSFHFDKLRWFT